ncbi:hypothetical protein [Bradyrhizobium pachyrhizi]|uniref:hypothetical protein n=1 Tax=Bradyrhizobium pachyrhizi TaxID=280333 RepID=UPI000B066A12|nr:hypothetical protein [Bradyrhizobium pachyrhizi]
MTESQRIALASLLNATYGAIALAAILTAAIPDPVHARDQAPTEKEKEACMEDVFRHCSNHIPDRVAIISCLRSKQASLSRQCRYVVSGRDSGTKNSDSK